MNFVIDVGPGWGKYVTILRPILEDTTFTAVEVWGPYARDYRLETKYEKVVVADVRYVSWDKVGRADVVIFGDVLEHMSAEDALAVYKSAGEVCDFLIISIPVSKASQGEVHGNPFETHVEDDWSHEKVMSTFPGIAFAQVSRNEKQDVLIGVYFASLYRKHHDILKAIYRQMAK